MIIKKNKDKTTPDLEVRSKIKKQFINKQNLTNYCMYKNLMLSQTFSNHLEQFYLSSYKLLQNFFYILIMWKIPDLAVRGCYASPHSKVKYNLQNPDLAVREMLCMPHSKVKYNI